MRPVHYTVNSQTGLGPGNADGSCSVSAPVREDRFPGQMTVYSCDPAECLLFLQHGARS